MSYLELIKQPEGLEAETYRKNDKLHDEIEEQIADFLRRGGKIESVPLGMSKDFISGIEDFPKKKREPHKPGTGEFIFENNVTTRSKAKPGYMNLVENREGTFTVCVAHTPLGTHLLEKALAVRDKFRAANGMIPAAY
jgi:hypothetical protein